MNRPESLRIEQHLRKSYFVGFYQQSNENLHKMAHYLFIIVNRITRSIISDICSNYYISVLQSSHGFIRSCHAGTHEKRSPLAARLRPRTLDEFVGQDHIIGEGRLLRRAIIADRLFSSIIFTGPPGTGKTTLARLIALHTQAHFENISAVLAGVADLRR
jgi:AAA+ superfamily predicted ATPase